MFDTLEPPEQSVARRWPILMYGTYAVAGLALFVLGVRRHGFSQPFGLVVRAIIFVLSLTWLVTTLISTVPVTNRNVRVRIVILNLLLVAHEIAYI